MSTPPDQPGSDKPDKSKLSLGEQLDELLIQVEEVEPGTLEYEMLPQSYRAERAQKILAEQATAAPIENTSPKPTNQTPAPSAKPEAEADPEQADMLAALNSALQDLDSTPPADEPSASVEPAGPVEPEPATASNEVFDEVLAATPDEALSMEDKLQAEIASLMNAEPEAEVAAPQPAEPAATEPAEPVAANTPDAPDDELEGSFQPPAAVAETTAATPREATSTEDQIAKEIEGLLDTDQTTPADSAPAQAGIDELDQMLSQEIDADDELAGDFHSVEQLTAGIQTPEQVDASSDDAHAATARDVAAELDSQPEDLPEATFEPVNATSAANEDPFAALEQLPATPKQNKDQHEQEGKQRAAMHMPNWAYWIESARVHLLNICFVLNWPARRFLSTEWRANLGYIALLNLFFGVGLWIVLILF